MRYAFSMIELIFVIVMIGILASIAIPKLASTRSDAQAAICEREVTLLARELSSFYTRNGHGVFTNTLISKITNIRLLSVNTNENTGIVSNKNIIQGIEYKCDGSIIASFIYTYNVQSLRNGLILNIFDGISPASLLSSNTLKDNLNIGINGRYYIF